MAKGQSYPLLDQVADRGTRECLRMVMDQINQLRQPAANDYATVGYVDTLTAPTRIRSVLLANGAAPLDLTALRGQATQVQRAKLAVNPAGNPIPTPGQPFELLYDVDTTSLYYWDPATSTWTAI